MPFTPPDISQDPWTKVKTANGFAADDLISTLQKSIRRGLAENAALVAYEMYITGPECEDQIWSRLRIISVEDVGFGRIDAPVLIRALDEFRLAAAPRSHDRLAFLIHAVRVLALSPKDRSSDEMTNWLREAVHSGDAQPEVFDVALDMHTKRGQELGRGFGHFFTEGAHIENELPDRDRTYRERVMKLLETEGHLS
jgi:replication-associated recombination protein RarA